MRYNRQHRRRVGKSMREKERALFFFFESERESLINIWYIYPSYMNYDFNYNTYSSTVYNMVEIILI